MLAALLGLIGVFVGAVLTQLLTVSAERRKERLDAVVGIAVAGSRVIGAHDRLYEMLFLGNEVPPVESDRASAALKERSEAHYDWRSARSRVEILRAGDVQLSETMHKFEAFRAQATGWVMPYIQQGTGYDCRRYRDLQEETWRGMRATRHELMAVSRNRFNKNSAIWARWIHRPNSSTPLPATTG